MCQVVPHKAVAEVSKIANCRRLIAVNHADKWLGSGWGPRSIVEVVVVSVVVAVVAT